MYCRYCIIRMQKCNIHIFNIFTVNEEQEMSKMTLNTEQKTKGQVPNKCRHLISSAFTLALHLYSMSIRQHHSNHHYKSDVILRSIRSYLIRYTVYSESVRSSRAHVDRIHCTFTYPICPPHPIGTHSMYFSSQVKAESYRESTRGAVRRV